MAPDPDTAVLVDAYRLETGRRSAETTRDRAILVGARAVTGAGPRCHKAARVLDACIEAGLIRWVDDPEHEEPTPDA